MEIKKGKYYTYKQPNGFVVKALDDSTSEQFRGVVVLKGNYSWEVGNESTDWIVSSFVESNLSEFLIEAKKRYPLDSQYKSVFRLDNYCVYKITKKARIWTSSNEMGIEMGAGLVYNFNTNKWAEPVIEEDYKIEEKVMENQKLSRQGLKEIHGIACAKWQGKLYNVYGVRNPLDDYIELTHEEVEEIFKDCTPEQLPIVSKYLKRDDGSVNLSKLNSYDLLKLTDGLITVRQVGEYTNKAFYLNSDYTWVLKKDSEGIICLIPTRKI